jgi:hypothetical protein
VKIGVKAISLARRMMFRIAEVVVTRVQFEKPLFCTRSPATVPT